MKGNDRKRSTPIIKIEQEDEWFIAIDTTTDVASQGKTEEEARRNLQEALALFYDNTAAWNFAIGLNKVDGLYPTEDFMELIELEKRGKVTTEELLEYLNKKYKR